MNAALSVAIANFCVLPWSSAYLATALVSMMVWGVCGWGVIVPQQHRLVSMAPGAASLLLALNNTATYGGLACSSMLGGVLLLFLDAHKLSWVGAGMIAIALALAEITYLAMVRQRRKSYHDAEEAAA